MYDVRFLIDELMLRSLSWDRRHLWRQAGRMPAVPARRSHLWCDTPL